VKLRFLSRYRMLAWLPILRHAFFLPTTEVNSASTTRRTAGALVTVDCPTGAMKEYVRRSSRPVAAAVFVAVAMKKPLLR